MTTPDNINRKTNRLINEKSPYLLQHAYNPVDWFLGEKKLFRKPQKKINQSSFQSDILVVIGVMSIKDTTY